MIIGKQSPGDDYDDYLYDNYDEYDDEYDQGPGENDKS